MLQAADPPFSVPAPLAAGTAPLVVHLNHQRSVGGVENGLVNLIEHMPLERYRHVIICIENDANFQERIKTQIVEIITLSKRHGKDRAHYMRLYQILKRLRPSLIHTRNVASFEGALLAAVTGIKLRVHGELGSGLADLDGQDSKYKLLRQLLRPVVDHSGVDARNARQNCAADARDGRIGVAEPG